MAALMFCAMALTGCGSGGGDGQGSQVQMQNLASVDGTINDAMTDLDGVQVEGTKPAQNDAGATAGGSGSNMSAPATAQNAAQSDEEVVADQ